MQYCFDFKFGLITEVSSTQVNPENIGKCSADSTEKIAN
jgi:hypothetical protein